jgi:tryptophan-rich sensory protein
MGPRAKSLLAAVFFVAVSFAAAGVGQLAGPAGGGAWYRQLDKPAFTPPGWVFGPVWTALYLTMGLAAWLVWRRRGSADMRLPLGLFGVQLALNAAWSILFFGLHEPRWAFAELVALWAAIAATTAAFFRVSRPAGGLMLPYLAWVTFAGVLNLAVWRMNPGAS